MSQTDDIKKLRSLECELDTLKHKIRERQNIQRDAFNYFVNIFGITIEQPKENDEHINKALDVYQSLTDPIVCAYTNLKHNISQIILFAYGLKSEEDEYKRQLEEDELDELYVFQSYE